MKAWMWLALLLPIGGLNAQDATVAYWRFEDHEPGGRLTAFLGHPDPQTYTPTRDESPNGNELVTFNSPANEGYAVDTSGEFTGGVPGDTIPQTGEPNRLAVQFTGRQDFFTRPGAGINAHAFPGDFTIEASFLNTNPDIEYRTFLAKDRGPEPGPTGRFYFQLSGENGALRAAVTDRSGVDRVIQSAFVPSLDTWYHTALVSQGGILTLYLLQHDGWQVIGTVETAGGMFPIEANWAIGRAWFNGPADWWHGAVDEIRISSRALNPTEFLWSPPEKR
ncbi:MAG: LamG domain-containing protein [Terrimicrobiaceae bacterium]|nr:LamG domain-containing protein [Terrimicrobiaceae bacterium]